MGAQMLTGLGVAEQAYQAIRTDIIFGRLAPRERLRLERLKEQYATSVSTLREILSRLTSEGFVQAEGQRGFEVAPVSFKGLEEIAELRFLVEQHAIRGSFAAGDLEWEGAVVAAHHKLALHERAMLSSESLSLDSAHVERWKRYDLEFHQALVSACGSRELTDLHSATCSKYLRYQILAFVYRGKVAADEHARLMRAALDRDVRIAQRVLREHIDGCVADALSRGHLP
jgi:DNA-binding GntR family transcriptional regulator